MKAFGYYKHVTGWHFLIAAGIFLPNLALAATFQRAPASQESCELEAQANYKKRAVEVEMSSIAGNLSELEVGSARENLRQRLDKEKENCLHFVATRSRTTDASSGSM